MSGNEQAGFLTVGMNLQHGKTLVRIKENSNRVHCGSPLIWLLCLYPLCLYLRHPGCGDKMMRRAWQLNLHYLLMLLVGAVMNQTSKGSSSSPYGIGGGGKGKTTRRAVIARSLLGAVGGNSNKMKSRAWGLISLTCWWWWQ